ncbi:hypothetical protein [Caldibacillus debilis]|nr:hypothetical protein [Caldibacillus debilis]
MKEIAMEFFLFFQFILILIGFFAIILLYLRQNRFRELENRYRQMEKEMEDLIAGFLLEIKEENERFLAKYEELRNKGERQEKSGPPPAGNKNGLPSVAGSPSVSYRMAEKAYHAGKAAGSGKTRAPESSAGQGKGKPLAEGDPAGEGAPERKDDLLKKIQVLQKKGLSVEEIARSLQRGKTEVELLSKFYLNRPPGSPPGGAE